VAVGEKRIQTKEKYKLRLTTKRVIAFGIRERAAMSEITVSIILSRKFICTSVLFRTVSYIEVVIALYTGATRHVLKRVEFSTTILHQVKCTNFVT
jgi:hypothetical protein